MTKIIIKPAERKVIGSEAMLLMSFFQKACISPRDDRRPTKYLERYDSAIKVAGRVLGRLGLAKPNQQCAFGWLPTRHLIDLIAKQHASPLKAGMKPNRNAKIAFVDLLLEGADRKPVSKREADFTRKILEALGLFRVPEVANADRLLSDRSLMAKFKQHVDRAKFLRLARYRRNTVEPTLLRNADGIIRRIKPSRVQWLLFGETFDNWFPETTTRKRLTRLLLSQGVFRKGKRPNTATRRLWFAEFDRSITYYAMSRKRLRSYIRP